MPPTRSLSDVSTPIPNLIAGLTVLSLPENVTGIITFIEHHPATRELLIGVIEPVGGAAYRVNYGGSVLVTERLPGEVTLARYTPNGASLIVARIDPRTYPGRAEIWEEKATQRDLLISDGYAPSLSPDGNRIAFIRRITDPDLIGKHCLEQTNEVVCTALILFDRTTKTEKVLTMGSNLSGPAEWSPDSAWLTVGRSGEIGSGLEVLEISTQTLRRLIPLPNAPPDSDSFTAITWSPDSSAIFYATQGDILFLASVTPSLPIRRLNDAGASPHLSQKQPGAILYLKPLPVSSAADRVVEVWRLEAINTGRQERLSPAAIPCGSAFWSPDGGTLACAGQVDGQRAISLFILP
jgi:Tol biopolymer transport system component